MRYKGKSEISEADREKYADNLTPEELHEIIKRCHYAGNGMSVGFSVLFNILAGAPTKRDAYEATERLADQLRTALDRYYAGELENIEKKDGVKEVPGSLVTRLN